MRTDGDLSQQVRESFTQGTERAALTVQIIPMDMKDTLNSFDRNGYVTNLHQLRKANSAKGMSLCPWVCLQCERETCILIERMRQHTG